MTDVDSTAIGLAAAVIGCGILAVVVGFQRARHRHHVLVQRQRTSSRRSSKLASARRESLQHSLRALQHDDAVALPIGEPEEDELSAAAASSSSGAKQEKTKKKRRHRKKKRQRAKLRRMKTNTFDQEASTRKKRGKKRGKRKRKRHTAAVDSGLGVVDEEPEGSGGLRHTVAVDGRSDGRRLSRAEQAQVLAKARRLSVLSASARSQGHRRGVFPPLGVWS